MALLPVDEALARLLAGAGPIGAGSRAVWPRPPAACWPSRCRRLRTQPPFPASAMDGYAVRAADVAVCRRAADGHRRAPAGHAFGGAVGEGQAVRIFTGAPVPEGADTIAHPGECASASTATRSRWSRRSPPAATSGVGGLDFAEGDTAARKGPRARCGGPVAGGLRQPRARSPSLGGRWSPSSPPATNCCRPAARLAPTRSSASNAYGVAAIARRRRRGHRPRHRAATAWTRSRRWSTQALRRRGRHHRHAGRRLGRRPRPRPRGADRRACSSISGRSPCGRASR